MELVCETFGEVDLETTDSRFEKINDVGIYKIENKMVKFSSLRGIRINKNSYINCFDQIIEFMHKGQDNHLFSCTGLSKFTKSFSKTGNLTHLLASITDNYMEYSINNSATVLIKEGIFFYDGVCESAYISKALNDISTVYAFYSHDRLCLAYTLQHIRAYRDLLVLAMNDIGILQDPILSVAEKCSNILNDKKKITYLNMFDYLTNVAEYTQKEIENGGYSLLFMYRNLLGKFDKRNAQYSPWNLN